MAEFAVEDDWISRDGAVIISHTELSRLEWDG